MAADIRVHPPAGPEPGPDTGPDSGPERNPAEGGNVTVRSDPALIEAGWTRRNLADPSRARETADLYESLGFDVKLVDITPEDVAPSCRGCAPDICGSYVVVYTRKAKDADRERSSPGESPDAP